MSKKQTPDMFWSRVRQTTPDGCWDWLGSRNSSGYGTVSWHGRVVPAHRVAYWLSRGGIRLDTQFRVAGRAKKYTRFVLHTCDNRTCCNPKHLFLGSLRANMLDAYKKGRKQQPKSGHTNAKLTPSQVQQIRNRYDRGEETQVALARAFGVSQRTISLIVRRESYTDVEEG